ncbi:hypothetical protein Hanom_Chr09g00852181 [Helianthus anomalus]
MKGVLCKYPKFNIKDPLWLLLADFLSQVRERNKREIELEKDGWPAVAFSGNSRWPEVVGVVGFNLEPIIDATNVMVSFDLPKSLLKVLKIVEIKSVQNVIL